MTCARRTAVLVAVVVAALAGGAPAAADPARPTHFDSTVTAVAAADGAPVPVDVEVVGGDAYLVLAVAPGHRVEVPGYDGEPYLRFDVDGTVEVNTRSPARWLNDARFGALDVDVPVTADAEAPPDWAVVGTAGTYAWHDHRIHFMSPTLPPTVDRAAGVPQEVFSWEVPLFVDDRDVAIEGELAWLPGPSPVLPVALAVVALAAAVALSRAPTALRDAVLLGVAGLTGGVGVVAATVAPPGSDADPASIVLPGVAVALWLVGRHGLGVAPQRATVVRHAAALPLLGWAGWWLTTWIRPIPATWLPVGVFRALVAVTLAVGLAGLIVLIRHVVEATSLDRGPEAPGP